MSSTVRGTNGNDVFRPANLKASVIYEGLGGNDTYHCIVSSYYETIQGHPTGNLIYTRSTPLERANQGIDTAYLIANVPLPSVSYTLDYIERIVARTNTDWIVTTNGVASTITMAGGDDRVRAGGGNDTVSGFGGDDALYGEEGNDALLGGSGDDLLEGGSGRDVLNGGLGSDTASFADARSAVRASLDRGTVSTGDRLIGVENATGGAGGDTLVGNRLANRLEGGAGGDELRGEGGNDTLVGGKGGDSLWGGAGADDFVFDFSLTYARVPNTSPYIVYDYRATTIHNDVIHDFEIGRDLLVIDRFKVGQVGNSPNFPDDVTAEQVGADIVVYFGVPGTSTVRGTYPTDLSYGKVRIENVDLDDFLGRNPGTDPSFVFV